MKSTYNVEFAGNQIESKEVIARAKKVWVDAGNKNRKVKDLKTMDLYLKPEENAVYYVFNEEESGIYQIYKIHTFYNSSIIDIKTGNNSFCKHKFLLIIPRNF